MSKNASKVSFEFFPVKTEARAAALCDTARTLAALDPLFMSVTYGAGGSTRERTLGVLREMASAVKTPMAGHLTCVGASKEETDGVARSFWEAGVRHVVALRGDMPPGAGAYAPHPQGYDNAAALIAGLKKVAPFEISVAAYPEKHPDSSSPQADMENLKRKLEAGADRALTQFFFEPETFLRFRDRAVAVGIDKPIVPGILPIVNPEQAWKFADMCGAHVPDDLRALFDGLEDQPEARARVSTVVADRMCQTLKREGVDHFHIFTLNHVAPALALARFLGA